jgi:hypothetical protein
MLHVGFYKQLGLPAGRSVPTQPWRAQSSRGAEAAQHGSVRSMADHAFGFAHIQSDDAANTSHTRNFFA